MKHACPLCGGANDCGAETAESALDCWCFRASIPAELLKSVPEHLVGVSCICLGCVERFHESAKAKTNTKATEEDSDEA